VKNKVLLFLSYVLTALLACVITTWLILGNQLGSFSKLEQLEMLIDKNFIGEKDKTEIQDAAADAMVEALGDRWSYYIPADEYGAYQQQMKNEYVGIGVTVQVTEDGAGLEIVEVAPGGPAELVGLVPGDCIVAVEGELVADLTADQAKEKIKGEAGTVVDMTVKKGMETVEISLSRTAIKTPVATYQMLEHNIGLVTIENFDSRCAEETIDAIESLLSQGADKLIFDVRNNPGGYKSELVKVLDYLLADGVLFHSLYVNGEEEKEYAKEDCLDIPMAVLVNKNSYSAAEFFAAALSEHEVACVVGEKTVGKGYFQNVYPMSDGSAVGLSVGKYFTPNGVSLEGVGITPEYPVEVDEETFAKILYNSLQPEDDPQILAAVKALLGQ